MKLTTETPDQVAADWVRSYADVLARFLPRVPLIPVGPTRALVDLAARELAASVRYLRASDTDGEADPYEVAKAMQLEEEDVRRSFAQFGFQHEGTGGNCTAFIRRDAQGTELIVTSVEDECTAPTSFAEPCEVGYHDPAVGSPDRLRAPLRVRELLRLYATGQGVYR